MNVWSEDESYRALLDARLLAAANGGRNSFAELVGAASGAFPTLVLERVRARGIEIERPPADAVSPQPTPELHPLEFEWYFTDGCAKRVAATLADLPQPLACLGAPTVAAAWAHGGRRVVLFDKSPLLPLRLPETGGLLTLRRHDLRVPLAESRRFGAVFFDPPWYLSEFLNWLWQAAQLVQRGGAIAFPLLPPLVRPTARNERAALIDAARSLGRITIHEKALRYDTPLFEAETLRAAGVPVLAAWRAADLIVIEDVAAGSAPRPSATPMPASSWRSWIIGSQVAKLRCAGHSSPAQPIAPLSGANGWIYTSVSRRDPDRDFIDLWTSRNRVARVRDVGAVNRVLGRLARSPHRDIRDAASDTPGVADALTGVLADPEV